MDKYIQNNSVYPKKKRVYLDNAAATPVCNEVIFAMREVENMYNNPSGIYTSGVIVKDKINQARASIADVLNVKTSEIYFTGSATESINLGLIGYIKSLKYKSTVLTTNIEHPSVLESLKSLEAEGKIKLILMPVEQNGVLKPNTLRLALKDNLDVSLVSIMYANNEIGTIQPVKECGRIIDLFNQDKKKILMDDHRDVVFHIDATQAVNYLDMNMYKLKSHMCSFNASKIYGPKGVGVLYKKDNVKIMPLIYGGGQERGLRSGTEDVIKIVGLAKAVEVAEQIKKNEIIRLLNLQKSFIENIKLQIPELKVWGEENEYISAGGDMINVGLENENKISESQAKRDDDIKILQSNLNRLPNNINIGLPGMRSDEMVIRLDQLGFEVSHKSSCSSSDQSESYVLRALGASLEEANENIRITIGRETNGEDMENLIKAIRERYEKYKL